MTANATKKYIPVLEQVVKGINNYAGRSTKVAPDAIDERNEAAVLTTLKKGWEKDFVDPTSLRSDSIYELGTPVRVLLKHSGPFSKGFKQSFSDRIYKIVKINYSSPITYVLADVLTGQKLNGNFYKSQLSVALS